jgi:predicted component of type VI protein secretion system
MAENLIAKLREFAVEPGRYWLDTYALQAASEIEVLRKENQELQDAILHFESRITHLQTELTRVESAYSRGL